MHFLDDLYFTREYLKAGVLVSLLSVWVLVALFYYLNRYTRRRYFTIWTAAWLFYALWITWSFGFRGDPVQPLVLMLQQWCVGVSAVFLLWGSLDFMDQPVRSTMLGWFMLFLLLWSYLGAYYLSRPLELEVPVFTLIALGLAHVAWLSEISEPAALYRRNAPDGGVFPVGCVHGGVPISGELGGFDQPRALYPVGLQLLLAVSMIILVLEEFRETHQLALAETQTIKVERNALETRVHSTEERYRTLFDQAGEAIVITSADDFHILELNRAAERLLALTRAEAGRHTLKAFCQSWDSAAVTAQTPSDWVASLVRQQPSNLVRKDGGTVPVEIRGSTVDLDGQPAYQFFIAEVTERRQLEQQLRQSEKLSALGQMISGIAHELNNPLAVIKGYVQLILGHHEVPAQTRKDLEKVAQESNRAAKLVANFLSFARNQPAHRELLDLNKMVERLAELRRFDLMAGKTSIELKLEPTLPAILADPDQVQEVIVNLTNNSLQAMAGGTQPPRLRFSTGVVGKNVQLLLEDSGPGVPEELRAKIFEPFFTTKEVGTGTGLGLSLAHSLMTEHGGRIFYRNSELGGAGFVVEFPAAEGRPAATGDTTTMLVRPTAPLAPGQGSRVLVLDDEKGIADMLSEMLGILGYETRVCNAAADALEWIEKERFDAVISDYRMPGINGEQFYGLARDRKPELAPRIIFLTGDVVNEETQRFLQSTGNPHLAKPFDLAKVQKIVADTIRFGAPVSGTELKAREGQNGG